jgi:hypothetical protein
MAMITNHGDGVGGRLGSYDEPATAGARPKWSPRIAMLAGLAAAETYWLYAICIAHALTISVYLTDRSTNLRLLSGQIGDVNEVINWTGLVPSLLISVGLFASVWFVVRGTSSAFTRTGSGTADGLRAQ